MTRLAVSAECPHATVYQVTPFGMIPAACPHCKHAEILELQYRVSGLNSELSDACQHALRSDGERDHLRAALEHIKRSNACAHPQPVYINCPHCIAKAALEGVTDSASAQQKVSE